MIGGGMHGFGGLGGFGWPGMVLGWVLNLLVVVGVVLLIVWIARRVGGSSWDGRSYDGPARGGADPREILKTRYARGEIDRAQYQQMLADLSE